ncbi:hypothetical protein HK102_004877 [Quaeritorhiza haematococci]|nr:hypothetical protein HK102_004877 [Quaeritorhiza haematococci]
MSAAQKKPGWSVPPESLRTAGKPFGSTTGNPLTSKNTTKNTTQKTMIPPPKPTLGRMMTREPHLKVSQNAKGVSAMAYPNFKKNQPSVSKPLSIPAQRNQSAILSNSLPKSLLTNRRSSSSSYALAENVDPNSTSSHTYPTKIPTIRDKQIRALPSITNARYPAVPSFNAESKPVVKRNMPLSGFPQAQIHPDPRNKNSNKSIQKELIPESEKQGLATKIRSSVFFLEISDPELKESLTRQLRRIGAKIENFCQRGVKYMVTDRPPSSKQGQSTAERVGARVMTADYLQKKLQHFKKDQDGRENPNVAPTEDYKVFNGKYLLVEDATQHHSPIVAKEYPAVTDPIRPPWPRMFFNKSSKQCPFKYDGVVDDDDNKSNGADQSDESDVMDVRSQTGKGKANSKAETTKAAQQRKPSKSFRAMQPRISGKSFYEKPGICENCGVTFEKFYDHITTAQHQRWATVQGRFDEIDKFIETCQRPMAPASNVSHDRDGFSYASSIMATDESRETIQWEHYEGPPLEETASSAGLPMKDAAFDRERFRETFGKVTQSRSRDADGSDDPNDDLDDDDIFGYFVQNSSDNDQSDQHGTAKISDNEGPMQTNRKGKARREDPATNALLGRLLKYLPPFPASNILNSDIDLLEWTAARLQEAAHSQKKIKAQGGGCGAPNQPTPGASDSSSKDEEHTDEIASSREGRGSDNAGSADKNDPESSESEVASSDRGLDDTAKQDADESDAEDQSEHMQMAEEKNGAQPMDSDSTERRPSLDRTSSVVCAAQLNDADVFVDQLKETEESRKDKEQPNLREPEVFADDEKPEIPGRETQGHILDKSPNNAAPNAETREETYDAEMPDRVKVTTTQSHDRFGDCAMEELDVVEHGSGRSEQKTRRDDEPRERSERAANDGMPSKVEKLAAPLGGMLDIKTHEVNGGSAIVVRNIGELSTSAPVRHDKSGAPPVASGNDSSGDEPSRELCAPLNVRDDDSMDHSTSAVDTKINLNSGDLKPCEQSEDASPSSHPAPFANKGPDGLRLPVPVPFLEPDKRSVPSLSNPQSPPISMTPSPSHPSRKRIEGFFLDHAAYTKHSPFSVRKRKRSPTSAGQTACTPKSSAVNPPPSSSSCSSSAVVDRSCSQASQSEVVPTQMESANPFCNDPIAYTRNNSFNAKRRKKDGHMPVAPVAIATDKNTSIDAMQSPLPQSSPTASDETPKCSRQPDTSKTKSTARPGIMSVERVVNGDMPESTDTVTKAGSTTSLVSPPGQIKAPEWVLGETGECGAIFRGCRIANNESDEDDRCYDEQPEMLGNVERKEEGVVQEEEVSSERRAGDDLGGESQPEGMAVDTQCDAEIQVPQVVVHPTSDDEYQPSTARTDEQHQEEEESSDATDTAAFPSSRHEHDDHHIECTISTGDVAVCDAGYGIDSSADMTHCSGHSVTSPRLEDFHIHTSALPAIPSDPIVEQPTVEDHGSNPSYESAYHTIVTTDDPYTATSMTLTPMHQRAGDFTNLNSETPATEVNSGVFANADMSDMQPLLSMNEIPSETQIAGAESATIMGHSSGFDPVQIAASAENWGDHQSSVYSGGMPEQCMSAPAGENGDGNGAADLSVNELISLAAARALQPAPNQQTAETLLSSRTPSKPIEVEHQQNGNIMMTNQTPTPALENRNMVSLQQRPVLHTTPNVTSGAKAVQFNLDNVANTNVGTPMAVQAAQPQIHTDQTFGQQWIVTSEHVPRNPRQIYVQRGDYVTISEILQAAVSNTVTNGNATTNGTPSSARNNALLGGSANSNLLRAAASQISPPLYGANSCNVMPSPVSNSNTTRHQQLPVIVGGEFILVAYDVHCLAIPSKQQ